MMSNYKKIKMPCLEQLSLAVNFAKKSISYFMSDLKNNKNFGMNTIKNKIHELKLDSCFRNHFIKNFII